MEETLGVRWPGAAVGGGEKAADGGGEEREFIYPYPGGGLP